MRFPLLAVQRLLFCTAFQPGGGGGGIPSPLPPDKKKRRGAAHPSTPTSTSNSDSDGDDVNKNLTQSMSAAKIDSDDVGECGVVLVQQQDDDDFFEGIDGDDNSLSDEDVAYYTSECILEESLDNDDGESKPAAIRDAIKNNDPKYQLRGGDFAKHYDGLLKSDEVSSPEFKAFIIKLVKWVNSIDLKAFGTAKEMESNFNQKRDEIKKEMVAALEKNGREDIATTINLASKFSIGTLILFFLHYAPSGSNPVDDDDCNFCRLDQVRDLFGLLLIIFLLLQLSITHNIIIFIVLYRYDGKETTQLLHQRRKARIREDEEVELWGKIRYQQKQQDCLRRYVSYNPQEV